MIAACAVDNETLLARAKTQNDAAHAKAERGFFARGYRPTTVPTRTLRLEGLDDGCYDQGHAKADPIVLDVGGTKGTATYEAACGLVMRRKETLVARLAGDDHDTLLTRAKYGAYAIAPTGEIVRYALVPQVTESKRGYLEGVSCCCASPEPLTGRAPIEVLVGPDPAKGEVTVPYDIVVVTLCDPKAPQ